MVNNTLKNDQPKNIKQISLTRLTSSDLPFKFQESEAKNLSTINASCAEIISDLNNRFRIYRFDFKNIKLKQSTLLDRSMYLNQKKLFNDLNMTLKSLTSMFNSYWWLCDNHPLDYLSIKSPQNLPISDLNKAINQNWDKIESRINKFYKLLYQATFTRGFYFG